tara:strand:+ start:1116 stop:1472 length:357 start_codon:yes stop_codon:yes gene_type:complete
MSNIRSKWTNQEIKVHNFLKGNKIKHIMHPNLPGRPDIFLSESNSVIFLQGCFWHKCPKCYIEPKSNKKYWIPKINKNVKRDRNNARTLRLQGFKVLNIWEHEIRRNFSSAFEKIIGM